MYLRAMHSPGHIVVLLAAFCSLALADLGAEWQDAGVRNERGDVRVDDPSSVVVTVTTTVQP